MSPGIVKMSISGPSVPVRSRQSLLRIPALGPASITHANAPRNCGVTNDASINARTARLPGRSVRAVSHAIGAPTTSEKIPTQNASTSVFHSAFRRCASVNATR